MTWMHAEDCPPVTNRWNATSDPVLIEFRGRHKVAHFDYNTLAWVDEHGVIYRTEAGGVTGWMPIPRRGAEDAATEKLGPFRPRAPSQSPEARLASIEKKAAKMKGRLDDMEACAAGARKRAADVADRMAAANAALTKKVEEATARIAVLEAGQFRPPMWANPIVTCGPDGR